MVFTLDRAVRSALYTVGLISTKVVFTVVEVGAAVIEFEHAFDAC
jgi:hypothetical protein